MEGKLINLLMTSGIEPDELVLQRKWLDDQYAVLSCGDETEYYEAEGLLDLVEGILRLLSSEDKNIRNIYIRPKQSGTRRIVQNAEACSDGNGTHSLAGWMHIARAVGKLPVFVTIRCQEMHCRREMGYWIQRSRQPV